MEPPIDKATPIRKQQFVRYTSGFSLKSTIEAIDLFKRPLPGFNIKGRSDVASYCGAFASVLMALILTVYGLSKFI